MIYYANPSSIPIMDAMSAGRVGCVTTPDTGNRVFPDEWDVIADNGCFAGRWTHDRWCRWLLRLPRTVRFVVAPDVFDPSGGPCHTDTLTRWRHYGPFIARHGFTPAFVCQVGASCDSIPDDAPVVFLGGTTAWKLGHEASQIAAHVRAEGRWTHMGRVNSKLRLTAARSMGCDSVDGTYLTYGPDVNLKRLLSWLDDARSRPMLWEAVS